MPMAAPAARLRQDLSAPGLIRLLRRAFAAVPDPRRAGSVEHALPDVLGAAFAMFHLKFGSMLDFDHRSRGADSADPHLIHNLEHLYGLGSVPSDSQMRDVLDRIPPEALRGAFETIHGALQRGKALEDFTGLGGRYILAIDGTGTFCSTTVSCPHCLVRRRAGGTTEYAHQAVAAAMVHPDRRGQALVVASEPISCADGAAKNDCERNAVGRLLDYLGTSPAFDKRRWLVVEDALAANGPHIEALIGHEMDFIVGHTPGTSSTLEAELQRRFEAGEFTECAETTDADGAVRGYRFLNDVGLNAGHRHVRVNHLEAWETDARGKERLFTWVTSLEITEENAAEIARTARSRWRIENELFNVLKNQGYEYGRNYGHGKRHLSSTLGAMTLLAFLVDQVQEQSCRVYQEARRAQRTLKGLWRRMRVVMELLYVSDWATMWTLMIDPDAAMNTEVQPRAG